MPDSPALDAARIIAAGVRIADADGVAAVTMRRLAAEFGVTAMALYRHIGDRESLVRDMAAAAVARLPLLAPDGGDWRADIHHLAAAEWRAFAEHPWLLDVVLTPHRMLRLASPDETEAFFARLVAAGLDADDAHDVLLGVSAAVIGMAQVRFAVPDAPVATSTDVTHPLSAAFERRGTDAAHVERALEGTIRRLLDGIAVEIGDTRRHDEEQEQKGTDHP